MLCSWGTCRFEFMLQKSLIDTKHTGTYGKKWIIYSFGNFKRLIFFPGKYKKGVQSVYINGRQHSMNHPYCLGYVCLWIYHAKAILDAIIWLACLKSWIIQVFSNFHILICFSQQKIIHLVQSFKNVLEFTARNVASLLLRVLVLLNSLYKSL